MSAQHTPGPWSFDGESITAPDGLLLIGHPRSADEARANSILVAAAPELLAACERAEEDFDFYGKTMIPSDERERLAREACQMLRSAIAKARGGVS